MIKNKLKKEENVKQIDLVIENQKNKTDYILYFSYFYLQAFI
jgi:hypothetical protein